MRSKEVRDIGGKTPLIMRGACGNERSIEPPLSCARTNTSHINKQEKPTKKRKMGKKVTSGRRKARSA